ncbi:MAG: hypothetical protein K8S23_01645 [Candidatus Cloacimonetes bacterium]|nr:hypothetical protein [Candidatus Cloacimonadota bacterium]
MQKIILLHLFLSVFLVLFGQIDEKKILLRQANQLTSRRKFERANKIYEDLLKKYPSDYQIAEKLIGNYIINSKISKADSLLKIKKIFFPKFNYSIKKIGIDLTKGNVKQAKKISDKYFKDFPGKINEYRNFALIFEMFHHYEYANELYKKARRISKDESLYSKELAGNYQNIKEYDNSIKEYINYLKKNKKYLHFIIGKFKNILKEDSSKITLMKKFLETSEDEILLELLALSLAHQNHITDAIEIYKKLQPNKLLLFADQLVAQNNYEIALQAYLDYSAIIKDTYKISDAKIKIAQLYILDKKYDLAQQYLIQVYNDKSLQSKRHRNRTNSGKMCREILGDLSIMNNESEETIVGYYRDAKKFALNLNEKYKLEFKIVHYLMMKGDYDRSRKSLMILMNQQEKGSSTYNLGSYYSYLLSIFTNDAAANSLLTEMIVNIPDNEIINDVLWISKLINNLDEELKETLFNALKQKELYHVPQAIETLTAEDIGNEELIFLALEWALQNHYHEYVKEIVERKFENNDFAEYMLLSKNQIEFPENYDVTKIEDFLKDHPSSVFAPSFRKLYQKVGKNE